MCNCARDDCGEVDVISVIRVRVLLKFDFDVVCRCSTRFGDDQIRRLLVRHARGIFMHVVMVELEEMPLSVFVKCLLAKNLFKTRID